MESLRKRRWAWENQWNPLMSASDPEIQTHSSVQFSYPVRFWRMPARLSQLWIYSLRRGDFTGFILTPEAFSQKSQKYISSVTAMRWDCFILPRHGWMTTLRTLNILLLVGACYRPPDQTMFYEILEEVLKVYGLCQFGSYHDRRF